MLARVALIKFLRIELNGQFAQVLERCRMMLKNYEGVRQGKAMEHRDRVATFQVAKRIVLRKTGQELFRTMREMDKETLAKMRRSLFGNRGEAAYKLLMNPLMFTEDGRDTYLNAEHYVLLGNFDRDPDRFSNVRQIGCKFLQAFTTGSDIDNEAMLDSWLNVPENAEELVGAGSTDDATQNVRAQKARLAAWLEKRRPPLAPLRSVVGSMTRMRTAWTSSLVYRPASAPWLCQLSGMPLPWLVKASNPFHGSLPPA